MDAEKELYDFAYDWRAIKFANAAQESAKVGGYKLALRQLLTGVWYAGYAGREREGSGK